MLNMAKKHNEKILGQYFYVWSQISFDVNNNKNSSNEATISEGPRISR
jgi:hypothetical protein